MKGMADINEKMINAQRLNAFIIFNTLGVGSQTFPEGQKKSEIQWMVRLHKIGAQAIWHMMIIRVVLTASIEQYEFSGIFQVFRSSIHGFIVGYMFNLEWAFD